MIVRAQNSSLNQILPVLVLWFRVVRVHAQVVLGFAGWLVLVLVLGELLVLVSPPALGCFLRFSGNFWPFSVVLGWFWFWFNHLP